MTRINKYLAERGVCSRRKADVLVAEGRVKINGRVAVMGDAVSQEDEVAVDGRSISTQREEKVYYAFHKPVGIMSSVDPNGKDTITTFLEISSRIFPVGRLDVASSGLMILTNDGAFSEAITHPSRNHEKEYVVTVDKPISDDHMQEMANGVMVLGSKTKPARLKRIGPSKFSIVLTEGRNRQIRRMCEGLGYEVRKLARVRIMTLVLGDLEVGKFRPLTRKELSDLRAQMA